MPMTILVTPSKYIFVLFSKRRISLVSHFAVSRSNYESSSRDDVSESDYNFVQKEPDLCTVTTKEGCNHSSISTYKIYCFLFMFLNVGSFCDFFYVLCVYCVSVF